MRLGGGQDEERARRGFLQRLQQRVERLRGEHVDFVDDEDFVPVPGRKVADGLAQLPDFVDAAVGGRVDFEHIDGITGGDLETRRARPAGRDRWSNTACLSKTSSRPPVFFISGAVQGLGQNARRGGLPHAARPREDVAVRHAVVEDGVLQGLGDQPLADHFLEALRPILAGNDLIRHGDITPK